MGQARCRLALWLVDSLTMQLDLEWGYEDSCCVLRIS
jgi:hypothetical protein